jgi:phospholipid transport system transporter-binding protein
MSEAAIQFDSDRRARVTGRMGFATVMALWDQSQALFEGPDEVEVDLAGVTHADSAGLALLLEWHRYASRRGKTICFRNPSQQMLAIAKLSDLIGILHLEDGTS